MRATGCGPQAHAHALMPMPGFRGSGCKAHCAPPRLTLPAIDLYLVLGGFTSTGCTSLVSSSRMAFSMAMLAVLLCSCVCGAGGLVNTKLNDLLAAAMCAC